MLGGPEFRGSLLHLQAEPQGWEGRIWGGSALTRRTVLGPNMDVSRTYCSSPFCPSRCRRSRRAPGLIWGLRVCALWNLTEACPWALLEGEYGEGWPGMV